MVELKTRKETIFKIFLFLFSLFACFQNIVIYSFGNFGFKVFHLIAVLFILFMPLLNLKSIIIPCKELTLFFVFIIYSSLVQYSFYGFDSLIFNYIFGLYTLLIIVNFGKNISEKEWLKMLKLVAWIVLTAIFFKLVANFDAIVSFFRSPYGHVTIDTFFGGGVNLEATWIALLGVCFQKDKKGYIYSFLSFLVAVLYSSRVGVLAAVMVVLYLFIQYSDGLSLKNIKMVIFGLFICFLGLVVLNNYGYLDYTLSRFANVGNESGSLGRLRMWHYAYDLFWQHPFGCGLGNALPQLRLLTGIPFAENNMHNLFLQMLIDCGFIGFGYFCFIVVAFIKKNYKRIYKDPFATFVFLYLVLSLIQFRGGEPVMFIFLGVCLIKTKYRETLIN